MSNVFVQDALYLLLIIIEFILKVVYCVLYSVFFTLKLLLLYFFDVNMIESSKKRKRQSNDVPNQTVAVRGLIDANWQKLLSNNLIMDKKNEKAQETSQNQYTGFFRRARKKKAKDSTSLQSDLQTLNLSSNADKLVKNPNSSDINNLNGDVKNGINNENRPKNRLTKFLAMDCEMVGIGFDGNDHMLARVSIVNKFGDCVYDKFVKPREEVKDYRTDISGVRREDLLNAEEFSVVQKEIAEMMRGRILVGHSLKNDLSVLFLSHPKANIRDTSRYKPFRKITKGSTPSLKRLAKEILGIDIQHGEHSSVEDARAAMKLYCTVAKQWESGLSGSRRH